MNCRPKLATERVVSTDNEQRRPVSVLAVGDPDEWSQQGHQPPRDGGLAFVSYDELSEATIEQYCPTIICSPVLARAFDCVDLAALLNNLDYSGPYRAVSKDLPRPEVIVREVKQLFPGLDFGILTTN